MSFLTLFFMLMALLCDKTRVGWDCFYCYILKPKRCVCYCYTLDSEPIQVWLLIVLASYFLLIWGSLCEDYCCCWPLLICFILANLACDQFYPWGIWNSSFDSEVGLAAPSSMGFSIAWVCDLLSFLLIRCLFCCFNNWLWFMWWPTSEDLGRLRLNFL